MGNSTGGLWLQWQAIYKYPNLQGAFIWDWIDQGFAEMDENGVKYWAYGGDYGEKTPSDANFLCNGIIGPDRRPHPAMAEVKYAYSDIAFHHTDGGYEVENRFYFNNAARHGFLVREGDALERLAQVKRVAFDKTGTLTYGRPQVTAVKSFDYALTDDDLYLYTASVEKLSEHPLAQAVVASFAKNILPADAFKMYAGRGVEGKVNGLKITAGNEKLFAANGIIIAREITAAAQQYAQSGCSIIYIAVNGEAAGFIALADTVRPEAADMLAGVKRAGKTTMLLTGDHFNAAESVAAMVGVDEVYADCLPEDKLHIIAGYEDKGEHICMLGDGINDAPALKKACTGIAMGGVGSDIAVDAADIVLINDDFREFGHLLELSGQMMQTIRKNIIFSLVLNFTAIVLAVTGLLSPVAGALVHNAGSVAVIISSALLLKWRCHNACCRKQNKKLVHCAVQ